MMLSSQKIEEILAIKGNIRGSVFQADAKYILEIKGREGLAIFEKEIAKIGQPIKHGPEIVAVEWYPLSWEVLSLLAVGKVFNWGDSDFFKMGEAVPGYSFVFKTMLRHFSSMEEVFGEMSVYWQGHYSVGEFKLSKLSQMEKYAVLHLRDFNIHPVFCPYLKGFLKGAVRLVIGDQNISIEESRCAFMGAPYHEFIIKWE